LLNVNVPGTSGYSTLLKNVGELENKGWEFVLRTDNSFGDLKWKASINAATNANKILNLQGQVITGGFLNRAVEGQPLGVFVDQNMLVLILQMVMLFITRIQKILMDH
jgi:hypothetical protein